MNYEKFVDMFDNDDSIMHSDYIILYDDFQELCKRENITCLVYNIISCDELAKMMVISLEGELYVGYATRDGHSEAGEYSLCADTMKPFNKEEIAGKIEDIKNFFMVNLEELENLLNDNFVNKIIIKDTFKANK